MEEKGSTLVQILAVALCLTAFGFAIAAERRRSTVIDRPPLPLLSPTLCFVPSIPLSCWVPMPRIIVHGRCSE
ncbi:hypothetical protein B296_00027573 [Ensete ventricosum]|uniref:Uncharacterized protein n=1 Tax=Ensete ventricosum TaxID=4639 RepID=A0A426Z727_ENSVE|nr:hypothetical protein B296_00027573 [Ensete ventricosum]